MDRRRLELEKNSSILFALLMIANLFNYLFQIIMGRMLAPSDYGLLNTLLSLFTILSVSNGLFTAVSSQYTTRCHTLEQDGRIRDTVLFLFRLVIWFSAVVLAVGMIFSGALSAMLRVNDRPLVLFTLLVVMVNSLYPVFNGVLQGLKRFKAFSLTSILLSGVKLVLSVVLVWLGFRIYGVLTALLLSGIVALLFCFGRTRAFLQRKQEEGRPSIDYRSFFHYFGGVLVAQLLTAIITNGDMLLAGAFSTDATAAGVYSCGMVIGKIALYIANALVAALFPMVTEQHTQGRNTKPLFLKALLYGGVISTSYMGVMLILGKWVIRLLFGELYLGAYAYMLPIHVLVIAIVLITIEMNYLVALKQTRIFSCVLGAACIIILLLVLRFHADIAQIIWLMSGVLLPAFGVILLYILKSRSATEGAV